MCLEGEEFVRRFLMHVLPKGLMRIRHFGFLANRGRRDKLERIRRALAMPSAQATGQSEPPDHGEAGYPCAKCRQGRLHVIAQLAPRHRPWRPPEGPS